MSEKYQIIARKYRPQTFLEVVGQNAIVKTLKNAVRLNKVANAYLFTGSRGIGKTTLARLFAKILNCENPQENQEPCCKCRFCQEITYSNSLEVIEIDGASNRGIDDIRQINETVSYAPPSGKFKIYIIDEVHMLTKEAFNALLKTLEEPPPTVKFLFATTEPHKIPQTIISRCQRFDLSRISYELIINKLKAICEDLKREVNDEALYLIARFAEGSLRDAQSFLDQVLCYEEKTITVETINNSLGLVSQNSLFSIDEAVSKNNISFAFEFVDTLFKTGKDLNNFFEILIEHYRHILVIKIGKNNFSYLADEIKEKYITSAEFYTEEQCLYILDILITAIQNLQKNMTQKIYVEMILLQIIKSNNRISLPTLINRLSELEKKISKDIIPKTPENLQSQVSSPIKSKSISIKKEISPSNETVLFKEEKSHKTLETEILSSKKEPKNSKISEKTIASSFQQTNFINDMPSLTNQQIHNKGSILSDLNTKKSNIDKPKNVQKIDKKHHSHYDTLIRFSAVELMGIAKIEH